jgi:hypothetical protein
MKKHSGRSGGNPRTVWIRLQTFACAALAAAAMSGCATKETSTTMEKPKPDLPRFRQVVVDAMSLMNSTLDSLNQFTVHPNQKTYEAFAKSIHRIEVDSVAIRSRAQAMEARGEAYFEEWRQQLAQTTDEASRKLAEERRDDLKRTFDQIFKSARGTRPAFDSFLAGLRRIRAKVEKDPGFDTVNAARAVIASTEKSGHQVQEGLSEVLAELNYIATQLAPSKAAAAK